MTAELELVIELPVPFQFSTVYADSFFSGFIPKAHGTYDTGQDEAQQRIARLCGSMGAIGKKLLNAAWKLARNRSEGIALQMATMTVDKAVT